MGDKVRGSGTVKNSSGTEIGTYNTDDNGDSFHYDDNEQNDKDFYWNGAGWYVYPEGASLVNATKKCELTCILVDNESNCIKWSWQSWERSTPSDYWPSTPETGTMEI